MQPVWAIVLTHGGAEAVTAACIESLLVQDYSALTVLLVDNASFDGSGERLRDRFGGIEYLNTGANLGYTGGNNRGIAHATSRGAEWLLVLNNDTVLERSCVSTLVRSARSAGRVGAVAPKILYFDDPGVIWYAGGDYSMLKAVGTHRRENEADTPDEAARLDPVTFITGCCFLTPAAVMQELGGFREDFFMYCEDTELSLRLTRAGYGLYYQPAARLLHREPRGRRLATPFAAYYRDRNRRRLVRQHYGIGRRMLFALWFYPTRIVRLAEYLLRGDLAGAGAIATGAIAR